MENRTFQERIYKLINSTDYECIDEVNDELVELLVMYENLESRIEKLKESLASIADMDNPNAIKPDYWIDDSVAELVQVITTDTEIARAALAEDAKSKQNKD